MNHLSTAARRRKKINRIERKMNEKSFVPLRWEMNCKELRERDVEEEKNFLSQYPQEKSILLRYQDVGAMALGRKEKFSIPKMRWATQDNNIEIEFFLFTANRFYVIIYPWEKVVNSRRWHYYGWSNWLREGLCDLNVSWDEERRSEIFFIATTLSLYSTFFMSLN